MEEMSNVVKPSANNLAMKSAAGYAVYYLILIYLLKFLGIDQNNIDMPIIEKIIYYLATYIPFILAILYTQTTLKKELGGYISFGKAFTAGLRVSVYAGVLSGLIMLLYFKLDPSGYNAVMDAAIQSAGDDQQKLKGVEMMRPYMIYMIGFGAAISFAFFGIIISLITAGISKKEQAVY